MTTVYETMRVRDGDVPLLPRHRDRLTANAKASGLAAPDGFEEAVRSAIRPGPDQALRAEWDGRALRVTAKPLPSRRPMVVVTSSLAHPGYRVKTTDREVFERAREEAREHGADEALLVTDDGFVAEGTLFAIAWFDGDTLKVPSLDLRILPSIGRARMMEVAAALDYPVVEGRFRRAELTGKAAFAVTATRGVFRIASLDGAPVAGDPRISALTRAFWP